MELPIGETVAVIIRHYRAMLGLEQIDQVEAALLGRGEANLNVLVTVNEAQRFNLRIGIREAESERTLQREYDVLQLVPAGIGPHAYLVDLSRTRLSQPYMLLDYLDGEVKSSWDMTDLEAHARTLARLHQQKFAQHWRSQ
jgi:aminoglycoside phosphotransferase (APT) family kinase protein